MAEVRLTQTRKTEIGPFTTQGGKQLHTLRIMNGNKDGTTWYPQKTKSGAYAMISLDIESWKKVHAMLGQYLGLAGASEAELAAMTGGAIVHCKSCAKECGVAYCEDCTLSFISTAEAKALEEGRKMAQTEPEPEAAKEFEDEF
jgi:hypothetical protein